MCDAARAVRRTHHDAMPTTYAETFWFDLVVVVLICVVMPLGVLLLQSRRSRKRVVALTLLLLAAAWIGLFEHARMRRPEITARGVRNALRSVRDVDGSRESILARGVGESARRGSSARAGRRRGVRRERVRRFIDAASRPRSPSRAPRALKSLIPRLRREPFALSPAHSSLARVRARAVAPNPNLNLGTRQCPVSPH